MEKDPESHLHRVVFVCTGNFYRSRLAEEIFRFYAKSSQGDPVAFSRGLMVNGDLKGMHSGALSYLTAMGIDPAPVRDPMPLMVDELISANHLVLLNKSEHEPLMEREFKAVYRKFVSRNAVTCWNVFDVCAPTRGWKQDLRPGQPLESALEHIHFAVKDLSKTLSS